LLGIDNDNLHFIKDLVKKSYPYECCGLLIGTNTSEKKVVEVHPVQNKNAERTHDRYKKGLQIIGIYHSHPDHPAIPSAYDTEHAWVGYSYMIAAVEKGEPIDIRSWIFNEEKKQFEEEEIKLC